MMSAKRQIESQGPSLRREAASESMGPSGPFLQELLLQLLQLGLLDSYITCYYLPDMGWSRSTVIYVLTLVGNQSLKPWSPSLGRIARNSYTLTSG